MPDNDNRLDTIFRRIKNVERARKLRMNWDMPFAFKPWERIGEPVSEEALEEFLQWLRDNMLPEENGHGQGWDAAQFPSVKGLREFRYQAGTCTDSASLVAAKFGGMVVGLPSYEGFLEDADRARFSFTAYGFGVFDSFDVRQRQGHDFALVGRYLVDWWAVEHGYLRSAVWDSMNPDHREFVRWIYGDESCWLAHHSNDWRTGAPKIGGGYGE